MNRMISYLLAVVLLASATTAGSAVSIAQRAGTADQSLAAWLPQATWVLTTLNGDAVAPATAPHITFAPQNTFSGFAGCNSYSGRLDQHGAQLAVITLATTRMACPDREMVLERAYLDALTAVETYRLDGGDLVLHDHTGSHRLVFEARTP